MKHHNNSHPHSESRNGENTAANSDKEKRKTVYIKLHPKPNAPRHSALKPARAQLQPQ